MAGLSEKTTQSKSEYGMNTGNKTGGTMTEAFAEKQGINIDMKGDKEVTMKIDDNKATANEKTIEFRDKNVETVKGLEEKGEVVNKTVDKGQNTTSVKDTINMGDGGHKDKNTNLHNSVNDIVRDIKKDDISSGFVKESYANALNDKVQNVKAARDDELKTPRKLDPTHFDAKFIAVLAVSLVLGGPGVVGVFLAQRLTYQHLNKDAQISSGLANKIEAANDLMGKSGCSFDEALYRTISNEVSLHVGVDDLIERRNDVMKRDNVQEADGMRTAIFEHALERSGLGNIIEAAEQKFLDSNNSISYEKAFSEALKDCGCTRDDLKDKETKFEHEYKVDIAIMNNFDHIANCAYNKIFNATNVTEKTANVTFSADNAFHMTNYDKDHSFDRNDFDKLYSRAESYSEKHNSDIGKEIETQLFRESKVSLIKE